MHHLCYSLRGGALDGLVPHLLDRHRVARDGRDEDVGDARRLIRVGERAEDLDARVLPVRELAADKVTSCGARASRSARADCGGEMNEAHVRIKLDIAPEPRAKKAPKH